MGSTETEDFKGREPLGHDWWGTGLPATVMLIKIWIPNERVPRAWRSIRLQCVTTESLLDGGVASSGRESRGGAGRWGQRNRQWESNIRDGGRPESRAFTQQRNGFVTLWFTFKLKKKKKPFICCSATNKQSPLLTDVISLLIMKEGSHQCVTASVHTMATQSQNAWITSLSRAIPNSYSVLKAFCALLRGKPWPLSAFGCQNTIGQNAIVSRLNLLALHNVWKRSPNCQMPLTSPALLTPL